MNIEKFTAEELLNLYRYEIYEETYKEEEFDPTALTEIEQEIIKRMKKVKID